MKAGSKEREGIISACGGEADLLIADTLKTAGKMRAPPPPVPTSRDCNVEKDWENRGSLCPIIFRLGFSPFFFLSHEFCGYGHHEIQYIDPWRPK